MKKPSSIILLLRCKDTRLAEETLLELDHSGWVLHIPKKDTQQLTGFLFVVVS
jgi:hypothetical protein